MIMTLNEEISELDEIILKMSAQVRENLKYGMDAYLYYDRTKNTSLSTMLLLILTSVRLKAKR
jgi:hypothetical protein